MSRTIKQLDIGTSVYIEESGVPKEYILIRKDTEGCVLLRALPLVAQRMNSTNTAVYTDSEADNYLNNEETGFLSLFDSATKMAFVSRSRPTFEYGAQTCYYISRRAFLLTYGELYLSAPTAIEPLTTVVPALMNWSGKSDVSSSRIAYNEVEQAVIWWLSSPDSGSAFFCVNAGGGSSSLFATNGNCWLRPALNVSSDTIVSDEGADIIYLMPSKGYREVSFSGKALEIAKRPKKAVVEYNTSNLYDIQVEICNNYGDASPVWMPCTSGVEVELTNTVKQTTDWQVGIRCYGKSQGCGYFEEPIVKLGVA